MNHKNSVWTQLCEQLVVIIATITLFCLLPDFSDGNHSSSQINLLASQQKTQEENIKCSKLNNKHKKKKNKILSISQDNHRIALEQDLLLSSNEDLVDNETLSETELVEESTDPDFKDESITVAAEKLNRVEKLNAEIEEQAFVLTVQQDKLTEEVLNKIESNLLVIKKMAQKEGVDTLIDNPSIEEIDKKIALYRKNIIFS